MRDIVNPFIDAKAEDYHCFGCSPNNLHGLNLRFKEEDEVLYCDLTPNHFLEGYKDVMHGGIQATVHDEIAAWFVYAVCGTSGVTASIHITYRKPALMNQGLLKLKCSLKEQNRRFAILHTELTSTDGTLLSEAEVKYFIFPPEMAKTKYHYPGKEAFYA